MVYESAQAYPHFVCVVTMQNIEPVELVGGYSCPAIARLVPRLDGGERGVSSTDGEACRRNDASQNVSKHSFVNLGKARSMMLRTYCFGSYQFQRSIFENRPELVVRSLWVGVRGALGVCNWQSGEDVESHRTLPHNLVRILHGGTTPFIDDHLTHDILSRLLRSIPIKPINLLIKKYIYLACGLSQRLPCCSRAE